MALTTTVQTSIALTQTGTAGVGSLSNKINIAKTFTIANGTAANQADLVYTTSGTFSGSSTLNINLSSGSLTDAFGASFSFDRVKVLYVENNATAEANNDIVVGNGTNPVATFFSAGDESLKVKGGGIALLVAPLATGYAVTDSTGDVVKFATGSSASVPYKILFVGSSA